MENVLMRCAISLFMVLAFNEISSAYRILILTYPHSSPIMQAAAIASALEAKNHSAYLVLPKSIPQLDELKWRFNVIYYRIKYPDLYVQPMNWIGNNVTMAEFIRQAAEGSIIPFCKNALEDNLYIQELKATMFDLALVETGGQRCHMLILHKLGIPYASFVVNSEPWLSGNPALPSFVPSMFIGTFTEKMNLLERIKNLYAVVDWIAKPEVFVLENQFIQKYDPSITYEFLIGKNLLWFVDTDFLIDYKRPVMPNEVLIGGLTTKPAVGLPADLAEFADDAKQGLIIVAYGTLDTQLQATSSFEKTANAFGVLAEYRFVWRYSEVLTPSQESIIPKNVLVRKWIPQNDLLGHKSTKLLITHCGTNSQFEAIYHGIPMLCFPTWYDQPYNTGRMVYMGYGRSLNPVTFTSDQLVHEIQELVANNLTYLENIREASAIFRGRPDTPVERIVRWMEYAIEHGGKHLRSHALDMKWYEYWMVDILVLLVILPLMAMTSLVTCCFCFVYNRKKTSIDKMKKL